MLCIALCPFQFCNHLDGEERAGYFTLFDFLVSCDCYCSVALSHGALSWYAVCDCVFPDHTHLLFYARV